MSGDTPTRWMVYGLLIIVALTVIVAAYTVGVEATKCRAAGGEWIFASTGDHCVTPVDYEGKD